MLREAVAEDVPALVELLAADQLGATRDGITSQDDMRAYLRAFSVLNADPGLCCVGRSQAMPRRDLGPLCWSDGGFEFVECGGQPEQRPGVDGDLVVAAAEVLNEGVAPDHYARRWLSPEPPHRPEPDPRPWSHSIGWKSSGNIGARQLVSRLLLLLAD